MTLRQVDTASSKSIVPHISRYTTIPNRILMPSQELTTTSSQSQHAFCHDIEPQAQLHNDLWRYGHELLGLVISCA